MLCIDINDLEYNFWIINKNGSSSNRVAIRYDNRKSVPELNAELLNVLRFITNKESILQVVVICQIERMRSVIEKFVQEYFKTYPLFLDSKIGNEEFLTPFKIPIENIIMSHAVQKEYKKSDYIMISSGHFMTSISVIKNKKIIDIVFVEDFISLSESISRKYKVLPDFSNVQSTINEPAKSFEDAVNNGLFLSCVGGIDKVIDYFKVKYDCNFFVIASQSEDDKFLEYCCGINQIDYNLLNKGILNLI